MRPMIVVVAVAAAALLAASCTPPGGKAIERSGEVTRGTAPLTLLGPALKVGDRAPDFRLTRNDMTEARLADFAGRTILLSCVPSLDTKVCDLETRRFNESAADLPGVTVLTVSMDLPFAQARWCAAHDIKNVVTLSDFKTHDFGLAYGVLIKEMGLLTRTIFVIAPDGRVTYIQRVGDITQEPDYAAALAAARAAARPGPSKQTTSKIALAAAF
jgi:thioredoxin-dependent peroxiredoxin